MEDNIEVGGTAVPPLPFKMSQANQEFLGTTAGWSSATLSAAGLSIPGYVSRLAGKSAGYQFGIGYKLDNSDPSDVYTYYGWYPGYNIGSMSPTAISGTTDVMRGLMGYQETYTREGVEPQPSLYRTQIYFEAFCSRPAYSVTFPGLGTFTFNSNGQDRAIIEDGGAIWNWLKAKNGTVQQIQITPL